MRKEYLYFILLLIVGLAVLLWLVSSGSLLHGTVGDLYLAFGRLAGLLLAISVLFQFVIIGRVGWIEKIFGLDALSRLHHWVGFSTVFFLIAHPVGIGLGYGWGSSDSALHQITSLMFSGGEVLQATIGAFLFIVVAATSVYVLLKKLRYEYWYAIHLVTYIAVIISFSHQIELGGDLQAMIPRVLWIGLYVCAGLVYLWFRFAQPLIQYHAHAFFVDRIEPETESTYSIYISGKRMDTFHYIPGQFLMVRFLAKGVWYEAHPFSISVGSGTGDIRLTIKRLGDYTKKLSTHIQSGTKVFIDGPHGIFGATISEKEKILCLGGGVGITPIRSLAERAIHTRKDIKVLASFRTHHDAVFEREIAQLVGDENIAYVYTHESPYEGQVKNISHSTLLEFCPDVQERAVYLCGPAAFMKAMRTILLNHGVSEKQIYFERFSL